MFAMYVQLIFMLLRWSLDTALDYFTSLNKYFQLDRTMKEFLAPYNNLKWFLT